MTDANRISTAGELLWSGEHWINYLRPAGSDADTGMISLYLPYTSPAGAGTAAFVQIEGEDDFTDLCTDNEQFARFVKETQVVSSSPFDIDMPLTAARLSMRGDIRVQPGGKSPAASARSPPPGRRCKSRWSARREPTRGSSSPSWSSPTRAVSNSTAALWTVAPIRAMFGGTTSTGR